MAKEDFKEYMRSSTIIGGIEAILIVVLSGIQAIIRFFRELF